jgi:hypothetical protein
VKLVKPACYSSTCCCWQVEVLWVINQQQTKWEQALPQETAAALAQSRGGNKDSNILGDIVQGVQEAFQQGAQLGHC